MEFGITQTWDSLPVDHDPVRLRFSPGDGGLRMEVNAPFFNDPPAPVGPSGQPFPGLWDYEVVESFFLNSATEKYLEVEVCPHGQHLVLLLHSKRKAFLQQLPLTFVAAVMEGGRRWRGETLLPWRYFPPGVDMMNSYSIHGSGKLREYHALYPVPREHTLHTHTPDFHRLEYFQPFSLHCIMGDGWVQPESDLWKSE